MKIKPHSIRWQHVLHALFSLWLAFLLLFGTTSKELIHGFAHHEDTQECRQQQDGLHIEKPHRHCLFLTFQLLPFAAAQPFLWRPKVLTPVYQDWQQAWRVVVYSKPCVGKPQRGPPVPSCTIAGF